MSEYSIRERCKVNTNIESDTFVGIQCDMGELSVHFPMGYRISNNDKDLRKDILGLLSIVEKTVGRRDSKINSKGRDFVDSGFPIQSYLAIIYDFYERGYFKERDNEFTTSKRGKINWMKTIRNQKPLIQGDEIYYLNFTTKKNVVNENELITLVHEYCVYESFQKIGWLFSSYIPPKPRIKFNKVRFINLINDKLNRTFNDKNKALFINMIRIIEQSTDEKSKSDYKYGTYRFEYVWEAMINQVFGVKDKEKYFPKTTWYIEGYKRDNASLEPDSIMIYNNNVYVLDAKYYKYGVTKKIEHLPDSSSINKQITYGEYIANKMIKDGIVYNAFILPFDSLDNKWQTDKIINIGEATGNWRKNNKEYEYIQAILVDIKYLMNMYEQKELVQIQKLAECICNIKNTNN